MAVSSQDPCIELYNVEKGGLAYKIETRSSMENVSWHPKKMVLAYTEEDDKKKGDRNLDDAGIKLFMPL